MIDLSNITRLLDSKRLKEALAELEFLSSTIQDWQLQSDIEELRRAYSYMLQYLKQGVEDPNQKELYQSLVQKAYKLRDRLETLHAIKTDNSLYFETARKKSKHPGRSFDEILQQLELQANQFSTEPSSKSKLAIEEHDKALIELFEKAWVLTNLNDADAEELYKFLESIEIADNDLALLVSAVTMSALRIFDIHKLAFLYEAYDHEYTVTSQRALVGIALILLRHDQRIYQDSQAYAIIEKLTSLPDFIDRLHTVQMQLLLSRETEKIDKKMREELLPHMQKAVEQEKQKLDFSDIESFEMNNPEWSDNFNEKLSKHAKEISELQMIGADIYMGSFAQLKHYPFFQTMAHWFYQFDYNQVELNMFQKKRGKGITLFDLLFKSPAFCNSDKYSFYFSLAGLSAEQEALITNQLNMQQDELLEEQSDLLANLINREVGYEEVSRQYIHDLYRFFKLWRNRNEEVDIFKGALHLWECNSLKEAFKNRDELKEVADYFFRNNYPKEAAAVYELIIPYNPTEAELWQKVGYAYQKQKEFAKAIKNYQQADLVQPDSLWVFKNIAQCHHKLKEFKEALHYYQKAEQIEPNNLAIALHIGHCLVELKQYEEALPYFFKVEYYEKNPINAQRAIGWCSFVLGRYEEAVKQFGKVINSAKSTAQDWLNAGHSYYANKQISEAIACYQKAQEKAGGKEAFIAIFMADQSILLEHNFSQEAIYLIIDMVD